MVLLAHNNQPQTASRWVQLFLHNICVTNTQTDRQTDRPRYSVCSSRPNACHAA